MRSRGKKAPIKRIKVVLLCYKKNTVDIINSEFILIKVLQMTHPWCVFLSCSPLIKTAGLATGKPKSCVSRVGAPAP